MTKLENVLGYRGTLAQPVLALGRQRQSCLRAPHAYVEQHNQTKDLHSPWTRGWTLEGGDAVHAAHSQQVCPAASPEVAMEMHDGWRGAQTSETAHLGCSPSHIYSLVSTWDTGHMAEHRGHTAAYESLWGPQWLPVFSQARQASRALHIETGIQGLLAACGHTTSSFALPRAPLRDWGAAPILSLPPGSVQPGKRHLTCTFKFKGLRCS